MATSPQEIDWAGADEAYSPFPSFSTWIEEDLDLSAWDETVLEVEDVRTATSSDLKKALEFVRRAAAVETGAIEGLYDTDRGFTFTVANQVEIWQAAVRAKGDITSDLIRSQLRAYEYIVDFATGQQAITEAWVRELHETICAGQSEYTVHTPVGRQTRALPLGRYKEEPNHVLTPAGGVHSYCPVHDTPSEMHRLVAEVKSDAFQAAHPIVQAAFAHHALTAIHPFSDGNGRVARAMASVFTCRAASVPLLILTEHKVAYFQALAEADQRKLRPFLEFTLARGVDALRLGAEALRRARRPSLDEALGGLDRAYRTDGGFDHSEVDRAASHLWALAKKELQAVLNAAEESGRCEVRVGETQFSPPRLKSFRQRKRTKRGIPYRVTVTPPPKQMEVSGKLVAPLQGSVLIKLELLVPEDCRRMDEVGLFPSSDEHDEFTARVPELIPEPSPTTLARVRMWAEGLAASFLGQLEPVAQQALREKGYTSDPRRTKE